MPLCCREHIWHERSDLWQVAAGCKSRSCSLPHHRRAYHFVQCPAHPRWEPFYPPQPPSPLPPPFWLRPLTMLSTLTRPFSDIYLFTSITSQLADMCIICKYTLYWQPTPFHAKTCPCPYSHMPRHGRCQSLRHLRPLKVLLPLSLHSCSVPSRMLPYLAVQPGTCFVE